MQKQTAPESFPAVLGGDVIHCVSAEDANGVTRADEILATLTGGPYPRELIEYLSHLLGWYGRHRARLTLEKRHLPKASP